MIERDRLLERMEPITKCGLEVDEASHARGCRRLHDVGRSQRVRCGVARPVVRIFV